MQRLLKQIEDQYKNDHVVDVRSGDTVRVHQKIKEGNKERVQVFEGLVIGTRRKGSATSTISVRRIASGVGVEKTFQLHSPLITKVEVTKRSKVRRNRLNYMRKRSGKSARLTAVDFDSDAVNYVPDVEQPEPEPVAEKEAKPADEPTDEKAEMQAAKAEKQETKAEDNTEAKPEAEAKTKTKDQPQEAPKEDKVD